MRARRWLCLISIVALSTPLHGCGDDDVPPIPTRDGGARDGGPRDGGGGIDGGEELDGGELDGAVADGGDVDGGGGSACTADELEISTVTNPTNERLALAAGSSGFVVGWIQRLSGFHEVHWAHVPSAGEGAVIRHHEARAISGGLTATRHPPGGYLLGFHANPSGDYELYTLALDEDGAASAPADRWAMRPGRDDQLALTSIDGGTLAVWSQSPAGMIARTITAQWRSADGAPGTETVLADANEAGLGVALANLEAGALAAWVRQEAEGTSIVARSLDTRGAPTGALRTVSTEHNAEGSLDLAADDDGAVLAFGVVAGGGTDQVRVRRVDASAEPATPERIVGAGRDPSIVRSGGSFAVAMRREGRLELVFLNETLREISRIDLGPAGASGPLLVRVAGDGRLGVARAEDAGESARRVLLTRVTCSG